MNIFRNKNCSPTTYALAAYRAFGPQALEWDPLILRDAFQDKYKVQLTQTGFDKLMAGVSLIGTNLFNTSVQTFLAITSLYADKPIKQSQLAYVTLKDCCWAVFAWRDLLGITDQDQQKFDSDIIAYIQQLMKQDGISKLPEFMMFASLDDNDMTRIQQALVDDVDAFQAYNIRQQNQVQQIKAYIKQKQSDLVKELAELHKIVNYQSPFKITKNTPEKS